MNSNNVTWLCFTYVHSVLPYVCIPVVPIQFVMLIPDNDKRRTDFNAYPECSMCVKEWCGGAGRFTRPN